MVLCHANVKEAHVCADGDSFACRQAQCHLLSRRDFQCLLHWKCWGFQCHSMLVVCISLLCSAG